MLSSYAMNQNRLGTSDLLVSEVGYGCMSLGLDHNENAQLLHRAYDAGVTFFDTADLYDHGENEVSVGKAFKGMRDEVVIATKVGNRWTDETSWRWDPSREWIEQAVFKSLKRLQTDYIDLYQLHGGTLDDPMDEAIAAFESLKEAGHIRAYGISSIRPNVIREWVTRSNMASVMMQHSLLDRRPEEEAFALLEENTISVIARGPVAKGLLAGKPADEYLEHTQDQVAAVQQGLEDLTTPERSSAQMALRYALTSPVVATVVPGASRQEQSEENVGAAKVELSEEEISQLRDLAPAHQYTKHR